MSRHERWRGRCRCRQCQRRRARRLRYRSALIFAPQAYTPASFFVGSPELRLLLGMGHALCNYLVERLVTEVGPFTGDGGELTEELRAEIQANIEAEIGKAPHPEALDPLLTPVDERQEGRSEVIRDIANPKQS